MDGNTLMAIALKALKNSKSGGGESIETDKSLTKKEQQLMPKLQEMPLLR